MAAQSWDSRVNPSPTPSLSFTQVISEVLGKSRLTLESTSKEKAMNVLISGIPLQFEFSCLGMVMCFFWDWGASPNVLLLVEPHEDMYQLKSSKPTWELVLPA
jgi:hypothetical protein